MNKYKIQLFNYITKVDYPKFLWISNKHLEEELDNIKHNRPLTTIGENIYTTSNKFDEEEDLDLFQATIWKDRLTKLGVECEIVKIDYSEE